MYASLDPLATIFFYAKSEQKNTLKQAEKTQLVIVPPTVTTDRSYLEKNV